MTEAADDPIPFIGAFESTYLPEHDRDVTETTEHSVRWEADLRLLRSCNVTRVRYPILWHRIEPEPGEFDWRHTDAVLGHIRDRGMEPIVDLLHHTSYPAWLGDFSSPTFADRFLRYVEAVAERYPWIPAYTVCNEPFTTFLLCGQMGLWPPHRRGLGGFIDVTRNVLPAVTGAARYLHDALPDAEHVHVEACERHTSAGAAADEHVARANDRRFLITDLLVGRDVDRERPFVQELVRAGGADLLDVAPGHVDVLGLDYYAHNQWHWRQPDDGTNMPPAPPPLADLFEEYSARYQLPCILGETNIRGYASDRATWLKYTLEQCEIARERGVDVRGYCWFPFIDSADWASLLRECEGRIDPVGVFWLDERRDRRPSSMSVSYAIAAGGSRSAELPAFRLRRPVADWLRGWLPQMNHWDWQLPPARESCSSTHVAGETLELGDRDVA